MPEVRPFAGPVQRLLALLAEHPAGLTVAELAELARTRYRVPPARTAHLINDAIRAGAATQRNGRLHATTTTGNHEQHDPPPPARQGPTRAVIVDLESVVRTTQRRALHRQTHLPARRRPRQHRLRLGRRAPAVQRLGRATRRQLGILLRPRPRRTRRRVPSARRRRWQRLVEYCRRLRHDRRLQRHRSRLPAAGVSVDREDTAATCRGIRRRLLPDPRALADRTRPPPRRPWPTTSALDAADLGWHDAAEDCVLLARVLRHRGTTVRRAGPPPSRT